ncbi:hypothetical protein ACJDU8_19515 [Clostridium sp. WILCCON 0269]|uniref:Uncharacterized protein n=1 Tax=Candidatus Clostridium eludens TaxID=3381663 RepID=A0ABW8SRF3_9CLOT
MPKENPKLNEAWLKRLNNPKAIARYSTTSEIENDLESLSNNITPDNVKVHTFVQSFIV